LPKKDQALLIADCAATVESVKAASDVYSPLSGKVISVNAELAAYPEAVNQSPYEKGYFFVLELSNETEKAKLMDAVSYEKYVEGLAK